MNNAPDAAGVTWPSIVPLAAAVLAVSSACGTLPYSPRVAGRFTSQGGALGNFTLAPDRCYRSAGNSFDLTEAVRHQQVVRLTSESETDAGGRTTFRRVVRVANYAAAGGAREVAFRPAQCEVLVGYSHWVNLDGAVQLACRTEDGGRFTGYATFAGCP